MSTNLSITQNPHSMQRLFKGKNADEQRINWLALVAIGLNEKDVIYVVTELMTLRGALEKLGCKCTHRPESATVTILYRPKENELLSMSMRMKKGSRILVFNEMEDIEKMTHRIFEIVIACIFDRQSNKVLRVIDPLEGGKRVKVENYINVELNDICDSALANHATKIASLR